MLEEPIPTESSNPRVPPIRLHLKQRSKLTSTSSTKNDIYTEQLSNSEVLKKESLSQTDFLQIPEWPAPQSSSNSRGEGKLRLIVDANIEYLFNLYTIYNKFSSHANPFDTSPSTIGEFVNYLGRFTEILDAAHIHIQEICTKIQKYGKKLVLSDTMTFEYTCQQFLVKLLCVIESIFLGETFLSEGKEKTLLQRVISWNRIEMTFCLIYWKYHHLFEVFNSNIENMSPHTHKPSFGPSHTLSPPSFLHSSIFASFSRFKQLLYSINGLIVYKRKSNVHEKLVCSFQQLQIYSKKAFDLLNRKIKQNFVVDEKEQSLFEVINIMANDFIQGNFHTSRPRKFIESRLPSNLSETITPYFENIGRMERRMHRQMFGEYWSRSSGGKINKANQDLGAVVDVDVGAEEDSNADLGGLFQIIGGDPEDSRDSWEYESNGSRGYHTHTYIQNWNSRRKALTPDNLNNYNTLNNQETYPEALGLEWEAEGVREKSPDLYGAFLKTPFYNREIAPTQNPKPVPEKLPPSPCPIYNILRNTPHDPFANDNPFMPDDSNREEDEYNKYEYHSSLFRVFGRMDEVITNFKGIFQEGGIHTPSVIHGAYDSRKYESQKMRSIVDEPLRLKYGSETNDPMLKEIKKLERRRGLLEKKLVELKGGVPLKAHGHGGGHPHHTASSDDSFDNLRLLTLSSIEDELPPQANKKKSLTKPLTSREFGFGDGTYIYIYIVMRRTTYIKSKPCVPGRKMSDEGSGNTVPMLLHQKTGYRGKRDLEVSENIDRFIQEELTNIQEEELDPPSIKVTRVMPIFDMGGVNTSLVAGGLSFTDIDTSELLDDCSFTYLPKGGGKKSTADLKRIYIYIYIIYRTKGRICG